MNEEVPVIVEVVTLKDGLTAKDVRGNIYKIESITLGSGFHRHTIKYDKHFLKEGSEARAEVLKNGKLNITNGNNGNTE